MSTALGFSNHLLLGLACFKLIAHFLEARSESFDLLLLLRYDRSLFFHFTMLFEKLVEQHRVHRFVANAVRLAVSITRDQTRIYFFYFFGHEPKLRNPFRIDFAVVTKGNGVKRED